MLQDSVKYAVLMPHGVDPLPCPEALPDVRKTEESTPCALSTKTQPDSRAAVQGMTDNNSAERGQAMINALCLACKRRSNNPSVKQLADRELDLGTNF
jgi:hypothetical protein